MVLLMMEDAIKSFADQFSFEPKITHGNKYYPKKKFVLIGMGGSHLAADLIKVWKPQFPLIVRPDYGLPAMNPTEHEQHTFIASSYSGNTEEPVEAYEEALDQKLSTIAIAAGGKLIEEAHAKGMPYIQMPDTGIQPRSALGFSLRAVLKTLGEDEALTETKTLANKLDPLAFEESGKSLAKELKGKVPVIYSSRRNFPIAYNWKIKMNETGKIPAFCNAFPEVNHNEMTGFDVQETTCALSDRFMFLLLTDDADHPQIQKRMHVLKSLYEDRGLPVKTLPLEGETVFHKIFSSLLLADWTTTSIARSNGMDPEPVPMVEEFKKKIL